MSSRVSLFPPFLNPGSYGAAVDKLHMILEAFGHGADIVPDLRYGEVTAARVCDLQRELYVEEIDGAFGPDTRAALRAQKGFDVDAISWAPQDGITSWVDGTGSCHIWPPHSIAK